MKNITLILVLTTATIISAFGQSELKYFKTHTYQIEVQNISNANVIDSLPITVGADKTLKIESVIFGGINSSGELLENATYMTLYLDNSILSRGTLSGQTTKQSVTNGLPFWLEPGNYTLKLMSWADSGFSGYRVQCKISAIEFSIVP